MNLIFVLSIWNSIRAAPQFCIFTTKSTQNTLAGKSTRRMDFLPRIVIFPFMSKGHTIPLIHLARLFCIHRHVAITIYTTPENYKFIFESLLDIDGDTISIIALPFPSNIPEIPLGVESTDKLSSISLFVPFANSTKLMQYDFEESVKKLLNVKLMISDGFLPWTLDSATKFNIPRLVFYGMNYYSMVMGMIIGTHDLFVGPEPDDEPITIPDFPLIQITRNDLGHPFNMRKPYGPIVNFVIETVTATVNSKGLLVNSFYELEPRFADYHNAHYSPKSWAIGPLCLAEPKKKKFEEVFDWMNQKQLEEKISDWMNEKLEEGIPILYIELGTQAEVSTDQLKELTVGLEKSEVTFLWVVSPKPGQEELIDEFAEKMKEKGLVIKEWVDRTVVLGHDAVKGFLSHCGWNSVMESICAEVPILAWPMMAEQHLNARMVVEEMMMGIRVETCDGSVRGFVKAEGFEKPVRELMMEGEIRDMVRKKAKKLCEAAKKAMDKGGSSWVALELVMAQFLGNSG